MSAVSGTAKQVQSGSPDAQEPTAEVTPQRHSSWRLLAYSGLSMPWSLAGLPILVYLPAFCAQELHLSPGWVGVMFLSARLWDAFSDVIVGWLSDRSLSRFGRRKPWVIGGAPFLMLTTWFLCNPPQGATLLYLTICAWLFYTAATAVGIPYISWGTELATDYVERTRVTAFRETFSMIGNLFFAAAPLLLLRSSAPLHEVLLLISVTVLILVPLTTAPLLWVPDRAPMQRMETQFLKGLAAARRDTVFLRFLLIPFFNNLIGGVMNSLTVFALGVGLHLPDKLFAVIFVIYVATLCALPATVRLGKRTEKHHLLAAAFVLQAIASGALAFAPIGNFPIVVAISIIMGIANSAVFILPTSMLADVIDNGEIVDGERRSGIYVAIFNLVVKLGLALGVGLAFGLLDLVQYEPTAAHHTAADEMNIRLLAFGLPALLFIPGLLPLLTYPITRKVHRQLRERIDARPSSLFG